MSSPATASSWTAPSSHAPVGGARAYLELRIEQGPVLESRGESAAAVLGTFGVERHLAVFTGQTAHAGATPMQLRHDTFVATSQAVLQIKQVGLAHDGGVCIIGGATSKPGVVTAVPGRTEMLLDQRHFDPGQLAASSPRPARPASRPPPTRAAKPSCATSGRSSRSPSTTA
jgi:hypothetical protein